MSLARLIPPPLKGPHLISRHLAPPAHAPTYASTSPHTHTPVSRTHTAHPHATRTTLSSGVRRTVLRSVASLAMADDAVYPVPQPSVTAPAAWHARSPLAGGISCGR